jgi:hypothetical protein
VDHEIRYRLGLPQSVYIGRLTKGYQLRSIKELKDGLLRLFRGPVSKGHPAVTSSG